MINDVLAVEAFSETTEARENCLGIFYRILEAAHMGCWYIKSKLTSDEFKRLEKLGYTIILYGGTRRRWDKYHHGELIDNDNTYIIDWSEAEKNNLQWDSLSGQYVETFDHNTSK